MARPWSSAATSRPPMPPSTSSTAFSSRRRADGTSGVLGDVPERRSGRPGHRPASAGTGPGLRSSGQRPRLVASFVPHHVERPMATAQDMIDAVTTDDAARITEMLAEDPGLAAARDRGGVSALMLSRYRFDRATTDALLAVDPDLDVFEATTLGYIDRLRERLEEDHWRARAYSADGFTALHFAGFFGKPEAAKTLIEAGAQGKPHSTDDFQGQALPTGGAGRHIEVCRVLIAAGADVNATQRHGFTPLHAAAQHGDPEMVELFLSAGADPSAVTDEGATAADIADGEGHVDVARRLREVAATG